MNVTNTHDHDWAVHLLTAYSVGMLPEEQALRLEEHLRDCSDCRARLAPLKSLPGGEAGHLPASLIATWPRATRLLSGIERGLVESHLRSCEACRATLAFAGHEPVLSPASVTTPRRPALVRVRRAAWGWALGLSGVAAAAAWLLVVQPALFPRDPRTSATMGPLAPRISERGGFELALPPSTPGAIALPEVVPGSEPSAFTASLSASGGLVVRVPQGLRPRTPADDARGVTLTVLRAGREFAHRTCHLGDLGQVIGLRSETRLAPGDYELRIEGASTPTSAAAQVSSWVLRVR